VRDIDPITGELRQAAGITTRLLLTYVRRAAGPGSVDEVLRRCGLEDRLEQLLDERTWWSLDTKLRLMEAAAAVLEDPSVTRHAGAAALELNVGAGLKIALRALGSPRMVYDNIVRANSRFATSHRMERLELTGERARIRFVTVDDDAVYHPLDCLYNQGLLACVPRMFGLPPARIAHAECGVRGADGCVYDITWQSGGNPVRSTVAGLTGAAAAGLAAALFAPVALPAVLVASAGAGTWVASRRGARLRRRLSELERVVADQARVAEQAGASLQELVTDLDEREVLDKIVANTRTALAGKDVALLVDDDDGPCCAGAVGFSPEAVAALRAWAAGLGPVTDAVTIEDLSVVPGLSGVGRSLCAAPLVYRGRAIGLLVSAAAGPQAYLPRDTDLLRAYATQGAIALANARLFRVQQELATRDGLTGLLNHREFHETVGRELARARRDDGPVAVVLLDLDGFKQVNDRHGHSEGDRLLRAVASALGDVCRGSDMAFRVGGDEFALVLPGSGAAGGETVAARAVAAVAAADPRVGASYGVACAPDDAPGKDDLLARADERLYAMKRAGRIRS
jgi:diguanylate cyclase (GGDEF)-like protein